MIEQIQNLPSETSIRINNAIQDARTIVQNAFGDDFRQGNVEPLVTIGVVRISQRLSTETTPFLLTRFYLPYSHRLEYDPTVCEVRLIGEYLTKACSIGVRLHYSENNGAFRFIRGNVFQIIQH